MNNEMNRVILFFTIKHKGNWEKIYNSIKTKQPITLIEMNEMASKYSDDYIAIIDNQYPENFKSIYMPPLSLFTIGNKDLLFKNEKITSVWCENNYYQIAEKNLSKEIIYAVFFKSSELENINKLLNEGYKLIILEQNLDDRKNILKLSNKDFVYISEIPFEVSKADQDIDQTYERLLLGISKKAIAFNTDDCTAPNIVSLFEFEKREIEIYNKVDKEILKANTFIKEIQKDKLN
ncbi:MAG: hypothetical protein ACRC4L_02020 [Mycoplasma sp.]